MNGGKVKAEDQVLSAPDDGRVGVIKVKLPPKDATVSLKAYNNNGSSEPAQLQITWLGAGAVAKPNLYVLAVGVSKYEKAQNIDLKFADKDAQAPLACTVWDLSETGVRLVIPAPAEVPLEFELQIPAEDARARVRLVWNTGAHYGARFVD